MPPRYRYISNQEGSPSPTTYATADPSKNIGAVDSALRPEALTDELNWKNKFRRKDQQLQRSELPQAGPTAAAAAPTITQGVLNEILAPNPFSQSFNLALGTGNGRNAPPSLTQLAQGGQNHSQLWSGRIGNNGLQTTQQTPAGVTTGFQSPYGAGQTTFGNGPRNPVIRGAGVDTEDFLAGGRYSSYKPGSDPTLDRKKFSFGSAFR